MVLLPKHKRYEPAIAGIKLFNGKNKKKFKNLSFRRVSIKNYEECYLKFVNRKLDIVILLIFWARTVSRKVLWKGKK